MEKLLNFESTGSKKDFDLFLNRCKRFMKLADLADKVTADWWSSGFANAGYGYGENNKRQGLSAFENTGTVWQGLKKYGQYCFNGDNIAIDFDYAIGIIYICVKEK